MDMTFGETINPPVNDTHASSQVSPLANYKSLMAVSILFYLGIAGAFVAFLAFYITTPTYRDQTVVGATILPSNQGWNCSILGLYTNYVTLLFDGGASTALGGITHGGDPNDVVDVTEFELDRSDVWTADSFAAGTRFYLVKDNVYGGSEFLGLYDQSEQRTRYYSSFQDCTSRAKRYIKLMDVADVPLKDESDDYALYLDNAAFIVYNQELKVNVEGFGANVTGYVGWTLNTIATIDGTNVSAKFAYAKTEVTTAQFDAQVLHYLEVLDRVLPVELSDKFCQGICKPFEYFPPYACTRVVKEYKPNVEVLSLSVSNTSIIASLLLMFISLALYMSFKIRGQEAVFAEHVEVNA